MRMALVSASIAAQVSAAHASDGSKSPPWIVSATSLIRLAAVYGVSAERIRQIEVAAMKKMKKVLAAYA